MLYKWARHTWRFTRWLWIAITSFILIPSLVNILLAPAKTFSQSFPDTILGILVLRFPYNIIGLSIFSLLLMITTIALILVARDNTLLDTQVMRKYLRTVVEANQGLNPRGIAQQSQALISVNVPLDEIFVHLNATSDRPVYDWPAEQLELLKEMRTREGISEEEREDLLRRMRDAWQSEVGQMSAERQQQNVQIETVLQQLTANNPATIILGAPGAGKTTLLRWLALHMARASLSTQHRLPDRLAPKQFPLLLRVSDYAKQLSSNTALSVEQFIRQHLATMYPDWNDLATRIFNELKAGHCLILFDGLDEVASNTLRRQVAGNVFNFITNYAPDNTKARSYNRFLITSRIVGYEASTFARYAHYTLLDLADAQIELFLSNWCPAVERYQALFAQGMRELSTQQKEQAARTGAEQRTRLLAILKKSPGIKRLAINPLMLTIMALIQRSGRTLPHRRVELYQLVTRTLLDTWNQESGRRVLPVEEVALAERVLGELAYRLHSTDPMLTETDVIIITRKAMTDFYQRPSGQVSEHEARIFVDTLRSSSGLFVESGQGIFNFMHRTFREYFVAQYLLRKSQEEQIEFVHEHYREVIWHEPLLLVIAYKSVRSSREEQQQASALIQAITASGDAYDTVLQRHILFAAESATDCSAWTIEKTLQHSIANHLFTIYGDTLDKGRYGQLQLEIERTVLMWLRGQPQDSSQRSAFPPLLEAWRVALCDGQNTLRQKGAVHLLASIAPELADCPAQVLLAVTPPLLQLANLQQAACPANIRDNMPEPAALASSPLVEDYACLALRLLDTAGPARWLHSAWLAWAEQLPQYLERLTDHALEINYPLTPAALPSQSNSSAWEALLEVIKQWRRHGWSDPRDLQRQLLLKSATARYPYAILLKEMLARETTTTLNDQTWLEIWDTYLQAEMARGNSATYQTSLSLRVLLARGSEALRQRLTDDIMNALADSGLLNIQALNVIAGIYLHHPHNTLHLRQLGNLSYPRYIDYLAQPGYHKYLKDVEYIQELARLQQDIAYKQQESLYEHQLRYARDIEGIQNIQEFQDWQELQNLQRLLDRNTLIETLCTQLRERSAISYMLLLALYALLINYKKIPQGIGQKVQASIEAFEQKGPSQTKEHHLLLSSIKALLNPTAATIVTSADEQEQIDQLASDLQAIVHKKQLTRAETEMLLQACLNASRVSPERMQEFGVLSVREFAWRLLTQPFGLSDDASTATLAALENDNATLCAAAALLLQNCKTLTGTTRRATAHTIMALLADDTRSLHPLNLPATMPMKRLDDLLFETLKVLAR